MKKVYQELASLIQARANCTAAGNAEWFERHTYRAAAIVAEYMPSGSGFDNGTLIDFDASAPDKLVFHTAYHHMDENGMYDGWTEHNVTVRPSLAFGIYIHISGRDRNGFKEYSHDCFHSALTADVVPAADKVAP